MLPDEPVTEVACEKASGRKCCVGGRSVLHQDGPRKFPTLFQLIDEPYFSKHSTTRLICRSEGKFRPWNLASRRLNAILTVVTELVSYHFFTTKILSSCPLFPVWQVMTFSRNTNIIIYNSFVTHYIYITLIHVIKTYFCRSVCTTMKAR